MIHKTLQKIKSNKKNITIKLLLYRLSSLQFVDRIIQINKGKVEFK